MAWPIGMSEHVRATRPAAAGEARPAVGFVLVGELLTDVDIASGANPDDVADDLRVAVRPAAVIDEPGDVAADSGITHPSSIDDEAPDAALCEVLVLALVAFLPRDL